MRSAVVRLTPDPVGSLTPDDVGRGVPGAAGRGLLVFHRAPAREIEVVVEAADAGQARRTATAACTRAFGATPEIAAVTFVSRGTDEDVHGVVAAFGVDARVRRTVVDGDEVVVVTLAAADRARVPEARLATALEAALNCEVRVEYG